MILDRYLVNEGHVHHFVVCHGAAGWDVCEEEDSKIIHQAHHDDWHRVERVVHRFEHAALTLEQAGWTEARLR